MSPSALPWIEEAAYSSFQHLIPELRDTSYQEWIEEHAKAVAYRQTRNGSVNIPVSPDEFSVWLQQNHEAAHLELLWIFAEEMAGRPGEAEQASNPK